MARVMIFVALALTLSVVVSVEVSGEENPATMSKEELVTALNKSRAAHSAAQQELSSTKMTLSTVQGRLDAIYAKRAREEAARKKHEKEHKARVKKREARKKQAKLDKKLKLADRMMENAMAFLSMKAAKNTADDGSIKQKAAILKAAREGGRAGAVKPLTKVARAAAVDAVKMARFNAKKSGVHSKHKLKKITTKAAMEAVQELLSRQDKVVETNALKYLKLAVKKYPPSAELADDTEPNNFSAPPMVHLGFDDDEEAVPAAPVDSAPVGLAAKYIEEAMPAKAAPAKAAPAKAAPAKAAPAKAAPAKAAPAKAAPAKAAPAPAKVAPVALPGLPAGMQLSPEMKQKILDAQSRLAAATAAADSAHAKREKVERKAALATKAAPAKAAPAKAAPAPAKVAPVTLPGLPAGMQLSPEMKQKILDAQSRLAAATAAADSAHAKREKVERKAALSADTIVPEA